MSTGNGAAAIGLANSNKIVNLGVYVQDAGETGVAGPSAKNNYAGVNGNVYYDHNVLGEEAGFTVLGNHSAAGGTNAQWVTTTAGLAAGTTKVAITSGDASADNATGTHGVYMVIPSTGVPANSWFWAFDLA